VMTEMTLLDPLFRRDKEMNIRRYCYKSLVPTLGMVFMLSACSSTVNWNYQRTPSTAFTQPQTTTLGSLFQEAADKHPAYPGSP
jgi:hypothetical protein